jgi:methionine-rich copper-binding protein CopC
MRTSALRSAWVAAVAALAVSLLVLPPASAHSEIESSAPADGATLSAPPQGVSFTFNEDLLEQGNAITLTEVATGTRLPLGEVQVDGATASAAWPAASPAGEFRAAYRVVSADGHPIDGAITFSVAQAVGQASAAPPVDVVPAAEAAGPAEPEDGAPGAWPLILAVAALAGAAGALLLRRGR